MPDGSHEGSPADKDYGSRVVASSRSIRSTSVGSHETITSATKEQGQIKDAKSWAEFRIAIATPQIFGQSYKADKKPEKTITDATPKASVEKKQHPYDKFIEDWKPGDPIPLVPPGHKYVLCRIGEPSTDTEYGLVKNKQQFVVNGKEYSEKGVLGMTLGDDSRLPNLLLRIARARNIPFDDQGRLRCPEDTPGGGQFTDLQLSNCMIPSARTAAGATARGAARAVRGAMENAVDIGQRIDSDRGQKIIGDLEIASRSEELRDVAKLRRAAAYRAVGKRSLLTGRRSLRSRRQMAKALGDAFPNVTKDEIDNFLDIPLDRFQSADEVADYVKFRWGMIEAFLLEARENKDWSNLLSSIRMSDLDPNGRDHIKTDLAQVRVEPDGTFVLLIGPQNLQSMYSFAKENKSYLAGLGADLRTFGHYIGTHEFGHFADFKAKLDKLGITNVVDVIDETGTKRKALDIPNSPQFAPLIKAFEQAPDIASKQVALDAIYGLLEQIMYTPSSSDSDVAKLVGSDYGHSRVEELSAEFYATWKLLYGSLLKSDPSLINSPTKEDLEKQINQEFEDRFGVPVSKIISGGPRVTPNPPSKTNRIMRRAGQKLSNVVDTRNEDRRRNQGRRYLSPQINAYASDIDFVDTPRKDGRTGEFYASRPQTPKEKGKELNTAALDTASKDILVDAAENYLDQIKTRFRSRMGLKNTDIIDINSILDQMATFEGTDGKQFGVWAAELHNMIILDRLMRTGELGLINDVKRDGRYQVFKLMGINVGTQKSDEYADIETKALPRKMRRVGRLLSARFDPRAEDGDGDGLVQDSTQFERPAQLTAPNNINLPVKKSRSEMSVAKRSLVKSKADIKKLTRDLIDANTDTYSDWTITQNSIIKQTPSMSVSQVRDYIQETTDRVESKFGFIRTVGDAKKILSQLFNDVKLKDVGNDYDTLTPEQKIVFIGIIDIASVVPEFKDWSIGFRPQDGDLGGATRIVESSTPSKLGDEDWDRSLPIKSKWIAIQIVTDGKLVRELSGDQAHIVMNPFTGRPTPQILSNEDIMGDNVGTQIMKTVYSSATSQTPKDKRRILHEIAQVGTLLNITHHEMGHAISESAAYDEIRADITPVARDEEIVSQILPKASRVAREIFAVKVNQVLQTLVQQAFQYDGIHQDLKDAVRDIPFEIQNIQAMLNATSDKMIANSLFEQIQLLENRLQTFREELARSRKVRNIRDTLESGSSNLVYAFMPFPPGHPLYGRDMKGNKKDFARQEVTDSIISLLTDPIFVEDVRNTHVYKKMFPDDPISNEVLQQDGTYKYRADISKFFDPKTPLGQLGLRLASMREISQRGVWDGITDKNEQREILEFVKLFSKYGSTKPYYAGLLLEPDDIEPAEFIAELTALFMSGHGLKDYVIPQTVKQNIIKWFDWAFRGRRWENIIHPDGKEILGV